MTPRFVPSSEGPPARRTRSYRKRIGILAFLVFFVLLIPLAWSSPRTPPAACGAALRLLSANLLMVNPDPAPLTAEITAADADILALQEYSPRWETALSALRRQYPYRIDRVQEDSFGNALWSKVPMTNALLWGLDDLPQSKGTISLGRGSFTIWNIHVLPPRTWEYAKAHAEEMDLLATAIELENNPLVVTGDFNSTGLSGFHRRVTKVLDDAWNLANSGGGATWPNGVFPLPPMRLDHIYLSRDLTIKQIQIGTGANSDHRPLLTELAPRAGGALCP